jgi:uncharacterized membrane protein
MNAVDIFRDGAVFAADGGLTGTGSSSIMGLLFMINTMFALVQTLREKRDRSKQREGGSYAN